MADDELNAVLRETKRAAKDLAKATARLSKKLLVHAESAARHPSGSAKKVGHRVSQELDAATREIERLLKDL